MQELSVRFAITASGVFFLTGLLTGIWKYVAIARSSDATAPVYVDIAHRASLMYSFASLVLAEFARQCPYSSAVKVMAVSGPVLFFGFAIFTYLVHGWLQDTDNQFASPHRLGALTLPGWLLKASMVALVVGEVGGFGVLFVGVMQKFWG